MSATPRRFTDADELLTGLGAAPPPAADGWEPPVPLTARRLLPPFPVDALPGWLAAQIRAVAEFTQTPADLAGCVALAVLSTAAGGRVEVEVRPGWYEPVNLYAVVALPPGSRKSAVFAAMTAPLLAAEGELVARTRPLIVQAELERQVASCQAERAAAVAANAPAGAGPAPLVEATDAAIHADSLTIPVLPRLVADDITPEAAASLLAEQGGRLAVLSAEGGIFATIAGRYSAGTPNLEVFLKGHAGDLLRVDRKGRPPEHVAHPALTLGLALQPEVLSQIADAPGFRGRGLLARILYALPENTVGRRRIGTDPVPGDVARTYATNVSTLVHTLATDGDPLRLLLDADAAARVLALEEGIEPRLGKAGDLAHIVDWASKFVGAVVRIAGLLHVADHRPQVWNLPLDAATIDAAARVGHYFLAHALAAFDHMGADPVLDDASQVLDRIVRMGKPQFTKRELFNAMPRGRFRKVADIEPALELLESHGHIRQELEPARPGPRGGRPRSVTYDVHPQYRSAEPAEPAKPRPDGGFAGSAGSAATSGPSDPTT